MLQSLGPRRIETVMEEGRRAGLSVEVPSWILKQNEWERS
jgi:hypothetical protein